MRALAQPMNQKGPASNPDATGWHRRRPTPRASKRSGWLAGLNVHGPAGSKYAPRQPDPGSEALQSTSAPQTPSSAVPFPSTRSALCSSHHALIQIACTTSTPSRVHSQPHALRANQSAIEGARLIPRSFQSRCHAVVTPMRGHQAVAPGVTSCASPAPAHANGSRH